MVITINGKDYLTIHDAAAFLGLTYGEVANLIHYHRALDSIKIGTSRLVSLESAQAYKARQEQSEQQAEVAHAA